MTRVYVRLGCKLERGAEGPQGKDLSTERDLPEETQEEIRPDIEEDIVSF